MATIITLKPGEEVTSSDLNTNFSNLNSAIATNSTNIGVNATSINSLSTAVTSINTNNSESISLSGTSVTLTNNRVHRITISGATTFTLPSPTNFSQMLVQVYMPTVYSLNLGTSKYFNNVAPNMSTTGRYTLIYEYDGSAWCVGALYRSA